ncbi:hypothetical protein BKA70DRAFT_1239616 [Coprinopsis sp. MPI-PUGE-AT-0042]|nr:hypothetical protein BKA70DRAFT_1239616 [Coprinopsis sp. MPI-PUGE-AT-0042]
MDVGGVPTSVLVLSAFHFEVVGAVEDAVLAFEESASQTLERRKVLPQAVAQARNLGKTPRDYTIGLGLVYLGSECSGRVQILLIAETACTIQSCTPEKINRRGTAHLTQRQSGREVREAESLILTTKSSCLMIVDASPLTTLDNTPKYGLEKRTMNRMDGEILTEVGTTLSSSPQVIGATKKVLARFLTLNDLRYHRGSVRGHPPFGVCVTLSFNRPSKETFPSEIEEGQGKGSGTGGGGGGKIVGVGGKNAPSMTVSSGPLNTAMRRRLTALRHAVRISLIQLHGASQKTQETRIATEMETNQRCANSRVDLIITVALDGGDVAVSVSIFPAMDLEVIGAMKHAVLA